MVGLTNKEVHDTDTFTSATLSIADAPFVTTFSNDTTVWNTFALTADGRNVYAAVAVGDGVGFDGSTIDYQLLAPADSGIETYSFYLELP
ncbi:MAG: hypothetical protein ACMXYM_00820 [Candidatus Woesearchaeota archaeon]